MDKTYRARRLAAALLLAGIMLAAGSLLVFGAFNGAALLGVTLVGAGLYTLAVRDA